MTAKSLKFLSCLSVAAAFALAAPPVQAGSHGNGAAGGGFPQYRNLADAQKACAGDTVVWGTNDDGDTVVWGTSCTDPSCQPVIWNQ